MAAMMIGDTTRAQHVAKAEADTVAAVGRERKKNAELPESSAKLVDRNGRRK